MHYYVHAKDNIPFHAIIFPGLLMAHGNGKPKYHLPDIMVSSEYIMVNGQKMSKSKGNLILATELLAEFDVDMIRYYFLRTNSTTKDTNFTFEDFVNVVNGELVNNFGNLVNRTLAFIKTKFDGVIPKISPVPAEVANVTTPAVLEYFRQMELGRVSNGLGIAMGLVDFGNKYFAGKKPWIDLSKETISNVVFIIDNVARMLDPFIPISSAKVLDWVRNYDVLPEIEVLFKRLDMKEIKQKFARYCK